MSYNYPPYGQTGSRSTARTLLILGGVVLALMGVGTVILFVLANRPGPAAATPPPPDLDVLTAREAYPPAVDLVRQQDPGAQLASGVGAWTPTIYRPNLEVGRTSWTFHFYLPAQQQMVWVVVNRRDQEPQITQVMDWATRPALLDDQSWQIDSPQAVQAALQTCQETLNAHADAQVEARLSLAASNRALIWEIIITSPSAPDAGCTTRIDATTGDLR